MLTRVRLVLFLLLSALMVLPGCVGTASVEEASEETEEDPTNCAPENPNVYLEVKPSVARLAVFADPAEKTPIGEIDAATALRRKLARETNGKFLTFVDVRTG